MNFHESGSHAIRVFMTACMTSYESGSQALKMVMSSCSYAYDVQIMWPVLLWHELLDDVDLQIFGVMQS